MKNFRKSKLIWLLVGLLVAVRCWRFIRQQHINPDISEGFEENELQNKNRYPHSYRYIHNPGPAVCGADREVDLLVMVASALGHQDRRDAIRNTWGSKQDLLSKNFKLVFLLGTTKDPEPELQNLLDEEASLHADIVQESFVDSYTNLTIKTVGGVKWAQSSCSQAKFVMKTDDDIFINTKLLADYLRRNSNVPRAIHGCIKNGPQVAPQPVNTLGLQFGRVHPPFTAGAGYVISADILGQLYHAATNLKMIKVEDAFLTGYCARAAGNVERVHNTLFSCGQLVNSNCEMRSRITGHKITPNRMYQLYSDLNNIC